MKKVIKNLVILLVVLSSATASYATTYPTVKLVENKILAVSLNDWTNTDLEISIQDQYGNILHSDQFRSQVGGRKRYNLKNLPDGEYVMVIESNMKKAIHNIEISSISVMVSEEESVVIFKPVLKTGNEYLDFNMLTLGRNVEVSISDKNGKFFSDSFSGLATVNRRFDIKNLPAGNYNLTVSGDNQYETYSFTK